MGGGTHGPDLELAAPALLNILKKYRRAVTLRFWGGEPPASLVHEPEVSWTPINLIDYAEFARYAVRQDCDIVIAPLADNQFNRCKSAIKFLEYSASGWPGVYSRVDPYTSVVIHGENGFLAATPVEWEKYLTHLIEHPVDRERLARQAMQSVQRDWLLSKNAGRWQDTYQKILANYAPARFSSPAVQVAKRMQRHHFEIQSELVENVQELNNRVWALSGLVAEKDHEVQTLASIQNSLSWQMMTAVWKLIATLAPPNSRREKFLRATAGAIMRRVSGFAHWLKRLLGGFKRPVSAPTTNPRKKETSSRQPAVAVPPTFESPRLLTSRRFRVLYITIDQNL
ncbi:MAG TPA: glycosyltransferase, partial [Anaerolineae bacterium]|nr:glycosyltransferase [Anaerolineae bacterium]